MQPGGRDGGNNQSTAGEKTGRCWRGLALYLRHEVGVLGTGLAVAAPARVPARAKGWYLFIERIHAMLFAGNILAMGSHRLMLITGPQHESPLASPEL